MNTQAQQITLAADNALRLLDMMQIQSDAIIRQLTDSQLPDSAQSVRGIRELIRDASAPLRNALQACTLVQPWADVALLRSAVRTLNDQHRRTSAGFYGLGARFFRARARAGVLEVFDFETWTAVPQDKAQFHDHNGQDISLS